MPDEGPENPRPEEIRHPDVNFELRDLSARGVLGFLIGLAIAGVLIHLILWGMFRYMARQKIQPPPINALTTSEQALKPQGDPALRFPAPRLQPDPVADLNKFRARNEEILNTYGWADKNAGLVHIPIERAIEMVAGQLPARETPPQQPPEAKTGAAPGQGWGTLPGGNK